MKCYDTCCQPEHDIEYTVLSRRYPRATRKVHTCTYCGQSIPVGSDCYVTNVLSESRVFSDYRHQICPPEEENQ